LDLYWKQSFLILGASLKLKTSRLFLAENILYLFTPFQTDDSANRHYATVKSDKCFGIISQLNGQAEPLGTLPYMALK